MPPINPEMVCQMFDRIAPTYDKANGVLSFGLDRSWRKQVATKVSRQENLILLDIATGTGDLMMAICHERPNVRTAVGIDVSLPMLKLGEEKAKPSYENRDISFRKGDACHLAFNDNSFDVVSIGFGIRNVADVQLALLEMLRVLTPGGQAYILEFSLPSNWLVRRVYLLYFRHILPLVGGLISKDYQAYRYLNQTVEAFFGVEEFQKLMNAAGFKDVRAVPLSFGIAQIYIGRK
jgi:demethylmenaquinone methyltransferase/2-methoxy-6-polyprenyl-1,4-benzoquinol methylase